MNRNILVFLPALFWTITSYILLTIPSSDLPSSDFFEIVYFDKWVHIGMFGLLVVLWSLPFLKRFQRQKIIIAITLLVISYGIIMEFVQKYFTIDRSFDITDIAADIIGASLGVVFIKILVKRKSMAKNKPL